MYTKQFEQLKWYAIYWAPFFCVMTYFCIFQEKPHKPAKVDKWDASATKNALDDAVKKVA